jgi:NAD(P)-dependent dehydrogenase (short-subunit alcohol dehydrogenase family)
MAKGTAVVVGGTQGLGRRLAERLVGMGRSVVITGRDASRTQAVADEIGGGTRAATLDLTDPHAIRGCLQDVGPVNRLVLSAIERDANTVKEYDVERAVRLATLKLVGYTQVVHCLHAAMGDGDSILLFGGLAKDRPYPGSTTVTSVNGAVQTMVRTFATELAPVRVNALHPGIVGDTPAWENASEVLERTRARTPTGRLVTMDEVTDAALMLLENGGVNGVNLNVDGGWLIL